MLRLLSGLSSRRLGAVDCRRPLIEGYEAKSVTESSVQGQRFFTIASA